MKKFLLALVLMVPMLAFTGCGGDDEPQASIAEADIVGTWTVTQMSQGGETTNVPEGYVVFDIKGDHSYTVRFLNDNYVGSWKLEGNTVIGITPDPITERLTFTSINGKNATINYSNSIGDKYVLKATKSNSSSVDSLADDVNWLNKNIAGEWYGYEYFNSLSSIWITNEYFKNNKFVFREDRSCTISGFPSGNCDDMFFIEHDGDKIYLRIGQIKRVVSIIDRDKKEIELHNYAKLRKVN